MEFHLASFSHASFVEDGSHERQLYLSTELLLDDVWKNWEISDAHPIGPPALATRTSPSVGLNRISHVGTAVGVEPLRLQTDAWKFQDYKCLSCTPVDSSKLPLHLHQHKHAAFRTTTNLSVDFNHYLSFSHRISVCLQTEHL